mmetsp:Transcript_19991/g.61732  ORF Transcript_19991/g.61732 Transcript_19991/m.61732 type:complete len:241 (+) Transcript_19991:80-802(+)
MSAQRTSLLAAVCLTASLLGVGAFRKNVERLETRSEDSVARLVNSPEEYATYVKPLVEGILGGGIVATDYDENETAVDSGKILFTVAGTCPGMFCADGQAATFAAFSRAEHGVASYWSKPGDLQECTVHRHAQGSKCQNGSDRFKGLEASFADGTVKVDEATGRAHLTRDGQKLFAYLAYVADWNPFHGTMDGWLLYQKSPADKAYYKARIHVKKDMAIEFKSGELPLADFWPVKDEVKL